MEPWSGALPRDSLLLEPFVPAIVRRRIANDPASVLQPTIDAWRGVILLADLSGFSTLAESFARRGPRGAEDLNDILRLFCGHLVDAVDLHGGEVLNFAGDAALALWPIGEGDGSVAARRAAQCALAVQHLFRGLGAPNGVRLNLRCGLGLGEVWSANVGGVAGRWEFLVAGEPLDQAVAAMTAAGVGEIAVSPSAWACIAPFAHGGSAGDSNVRLEAITRPVPLQPPVVAAYRGPADAVLRAYVPLSLQARLDARQSDWLAEFRRVTALFINLGALDYAAPGALDRLQAATVAVQTAVYRHGGSLNQLLVDDKGTVVVCGWGLALHVHGDDQVRAVRAALESRERLRDVGIPASFGLATGDVFTGLLGNTRRCTYAMIGDVVNVAARLMQAADGDILCDAASYEAAHKRVAFESLPLLHVQGRAQPVEVFRPVQPSSEGFSEIVGRVEQRRLLRERLEALVSGGSGSVVVLEGDPGIGKSRLVADLIDRAVARGVRTMVVTGDAIERSAPYYVWGALFDNLLGLERLAGRERAERRVMEVLASHPRLVPFAPLLNPVLRLNFRETEESGQIPPRGRALFTRDLLVHLFRSTCGGGATLLVLEDAHWLDSPSWALAEAIERELPGVLLVIATRRANPEDRPAELQRLVEREGTLVLRLDALTPEEAGRLACQRLRTRVLSEPVARLIRAKAEGNPLFTEELAYALRDRGLIEVDNGVCRFSAAAAGASMQLPNTVQVVVSSRIDQLTVPEQLTLKVASIFGHSFDLAGLRAIYPVEGGLEDLERQVDALVARDLVLCASTNPVPAYVFKHAITQEVAYSLLPYALRRQLHAAAATWYERQHPGDLSALYPLLAHHWSSAEAAAPALTYLEKAAEQALSRHANEEALRLFTEAVNIDEQLAPAAGDATVVVGRHLVSARDARRIRWERGLGDAATNLCRWQEGRRHFTNLLALIGRPLPAGNRVLALGIGTQILLQCGRRIAPRLFRPSPEAAADLLRQAVRAYERIGTISYQEGQTISVVHALVAGLNLAERLGPTPELALVYADVGNVLGLTPLRRFAGIYQRLAVQTANRLNDPLVATRVRARAAIYRLGNGDWTACDEVEAAMAVCDRIGDSYLWEENAAIRARVAQLRGEFGLAAQLAAEVTKRGATAVAIAHEIWGLAAEGWANLYLGRHDTALDRAKEGLRLFAAGGGTDWLAQLDFLGVTALVHLWRAELDAAYEEAGRVIDLVAKTPRFGYFAVLGMSAAAESCLAVWEADPSSSRGQEAASRARQLCRQIEKYARVNPPARARALLWRGCAEWLAGKHARAGSTWRHCLAESARFALPYEAARARYEIGRRLPADHADRRAHLGQAEEGFRALRAEADLRRVAQARHVP